MDTFRAECDRPNIIRPVPVVIIEAGRALLMCDFVPTGMPGSELNVENLQGPLNFPTKVGIQMQIEQRLAFMRE